MQKFHKFCPNCGDSIELVQFEDKARIQCNSCQSHFYFDPKVSSVCAVIHKGKVLLIKRGNEPGYGLWSLPGGYVDRFEMVENAVIREVHEELGINLKSLVLIGVYSNIDSPVIVIAFCSFGFEGQITNNNEVLDYDFFSPEALPPLAFETDSDVISKAMKS